MRNKIKQYVICGNREKNVKQSMKSSVADKVCISHEFNLLPPVRNVHFYHIEIKGTIFIGVIMIIFTIIIIIMVLIVTIVIIVVLVIGKTGIMTFNSLIIVVFFWCVYSCSICCMSDCRIFIVTSIIWLIIIILIMLIIWAIMINNNWYSSSIKRFIWCFIWIVMLMTCKIGWLSIPKAHW